LDSIWRDYHDEILLLQPLFLAGIKRGGRALDVGSGDGSSLRLMDRLGSRSVGLDTNPSGGVVVRGTATDIPFKDGSFELVVCLRTLQHVHDDERAVREIRRVLRPGGRLVLVVANKRSFTMVALKSRGDWRGRERIPYEWFKPYLEEEVRMLLERQGFNIVECGTAGYAPEVLRRRFPPFSRFALRLLRRLDGILRRVPVLGNRGSHVRVVAVLPVSTSGSPSSEQPA